MRTRKEARELHIFSPTIKDNSCPFGFPIPKRLKGGFRDLGQEQAGSLIQSQKVIGGTTKLGVASPYHTIEIVQAIAKDTRLARSRGSEGTEEPYGWAVDRTIGFHGKGHQEAELLIAHADDAWNSERVERQRQSSKDLQSLPFV